MGRGAQRDRVEPGAGEQRQPAVRASRQHQGQRAGPETIRRLSRALVEGGARLGLLQPPHMHDQRVEARPALRGEDPRDRRLARRIAAEPVHRLGRERDELASAQPPRGAFNRIVARRYDFGCHDGQLSTGLRGGKPRGLRAGSKRDRGA